MISGPSWRLARWSLAFLLGCFLAAAAAPQAEQRGRRQAAAGADETFRTDVPQQPYDIILGNAAASSVVASILAYSTMEGRLVYGTQPRKYSSATEPVQLVAGIPLEVKIEGLSADARYFYRFFSRGADERDFSASEEFSFHTQRARDAGFVYTVQADSHLDERTDPRLYEASLENALAAGPDFHIDLGDTFMTDKRRADFREALPQYLAQRYYLGRIGVSAPVFLVSGNHDGEDRARGTMGEWAREQRRKYFATPSDAYSDRGNYYAWEWGDALFVALDPFWATQRSRQGDNWSRTLGEEQYHWLRESLEGSRAKYKFVFIHHLVGGKDQAVRGGVASAGLFEWGGWNLDGVYAFEKHRPGWGKPIHQLLVDSGVTILFHGHDHLFAKEELDGVIYQLVPQPALDRHGTPRSVEEYGYVHGDVLGGPGHVRVTVSPAETLVELVPSYLEGRGRNGKAAYSYRVRPGCGEGCK